MVKNFLFVLQSTQYVSVFIEIDFNVPCSMKHLKALCLYYVLCSLELLFIFY